MKIIDVKTKSEEIQERKNLESCTRQSLKERMDGPVNVAVHGGAWNLASGKGAAGVRMFMWLFLSSRVLETFPSNLMILMFSVTNVQCFYY